MNQTSVVALIFFVLFYISITYPLTVIYMFSIILLYSLIDYNSKKNN